MLYCSYNPTSFCYSLPAGIVSILVFCSIKLRVPGKGKASFPLVMSVINSVSLNSVASYFLPANLARSVSSDDARLWLHHDLRLIGLGSDVCV